ncbi:MAG: polysaccharide biosynthesis/export family protein [Bacteroidales bacterium]|nr:polysaccharide biosynthesis/export family protein [Bacteroidales bacterium]
MKKRFDLWILAAVAIIPLSCSTPAKISYMRDLEYDVDYAVKPAPELKLKQDDRISIQVFSIDEELAAPFNTGAGFKGGEGIGSAISSTYLIDPEGNIDFPVLGKLNVEGKTLNEIKKEIGEEISRRGYIREPVVKADIENFTITVIGEIGEGIMNVDGNSINILQVIARSGGVTQTSRIPDVMVVRTENGIRKAYSINLQSKDLFDSPVFYLQQNDIVYMKPWGLQLSNGGDLFLKILSPVVASLSAISYMLLWTSR